MTLSAAQLVRKNWRNGQVLMNDQGKQDKSEYVQLKVININRSVAKLLNRR